METPAAAEVAVVAAPAEPEIDYGPEEWETAVISDSMKPLPIIRVSACIAHAKQTGQVAATIDCLGIGRFFAGHCTPVQFHAPLHFDPTFS